MPSPGLLSGLGISDTPVFLHKVDSKGLYTPGDSEEEFVQTALSRVFNEADDEYSFWRVEDDSQLGAVAASINATRSSDSERIALFATLPSELEDCASKIAQEDEDPACLNARGLHFSVVLQLDGARRLAQTHFKRKNGAQWLTSGSVNRIKATRAPCGCKAYRGHPEHCECEGLE